MGKHWDHVSDFAREVIEKQHVYFVATAPLSARGRINVSPKVGGGKGGGRVCTTRAWHLAMQTHSLNVSITAGPLQEGAEPAALTVAGCYVHLPATMTRSPSTPQGHCKETFSIIDKHTVAYLDLTGNGIVRCFMAALMGAQSNAGVRHIMAPACPPPPLCCPVAASV